LICGCLGNSVDLSGVDASKHTDHPHLKPTAPTQYFYIDVPVQIEIISIAHNYHNNLASSHCEYAHKIYTSILSSPIKWKYLDDAPDASILSGVDAEAMPSNVPQKVGGSVYSPVDQLGDVVASSDVATTWDYPIGSGTNRPWVKVMNYLDGSSEYNKSSSFALFTVIITLENKRTGASYGTYQIDVPLKVFLPLPCTYALQDRNDPTTSQDYHQIRTLDIRIITPFQIITANYITVQIIGYLHEGKVFFNIPSSYTYQQLLVWAVVNWYVSPFVFCPIINLIWVYFKFVKATDYDADVTIKWTSPVEYSLRTYYYNKG